MSLPVRVGTTTCSAWTPTGSSAQPQIDFALPLPSSPLHCTVASSQHHSASISCPARSARCGTTPEQCTQTAERGAAAAAGRTRGGDDGAAPGGGARAGRGAPRPPRGPPRAAAPRLPRRPRNLGAQAAAALAAAGCARPGPSPRGAPARRRRASAARRCCGACQACGLSKGGNGGAVALQAPPPLPQVPRRRAEHAGLRPQRRAGVAGRLRAARRRGRPRGAAGLAGAARRGRGGPRLGRGRGVALSALDFPARVARLAVVSVGHPACGAAAGGLEQRRVRLQDARRATNGPCPVGGTRPPPARAACGQQLRVADRVRTWRPAAAAVHAHPSPLAPPPPPAQRWWYLFLMADARAEALLAANGWALFREVLAAGGAARAVQDGYVAAMAAPGARARTRGGWGRRGRGAGRGAGRERARSNRDAPGAASDGKHARPRAPPRRRRAGGRARLVPRQPPPARDRGDCGAGALRAHHAGHPRAGGVPGERRRADAGAGPAARRCWGRARRRAWRGGRRPRPPPPPPLPCPPAARPRHAAPPPQMAASARFVAPPGSWRMVDLPGCGHWAQRDAGAASLAHCWWHSWPRGGRAAAAAVGRRTRVCSGAAPPAPCPRSLPLLARSSAAPRGGKSEELRGITHQGGVPRPSLPSVETRGQGATPPSVSAPHTGRSRRRRRASRRRARARAESP